MLTGRMADGSGSMNFVFALAAALLIGVGFVAQQHAAYREPLGEILHLRLLARLIRQRLWLVGIAAMVCGQLLSAVALGEADVSLVEPVLATSLIFALVFAHVLYREPLNRTVWQGALMVTVGSGLFLAFGRPHAGRPAGPESGRWFAVAVVVAFALVIVLSARPRSLRTKATLLAAAAGMLYGVQDVLTRSTLLVLRQGWGGLLTTWEPYVVVAVGIVGLLLAQSAFDAAPLRISLPATTAVEPVTGIVLGILIFYERLRLSPGALAAEVAGLLVMVGGIIILGRSPFLGKPDAAGPRTAS
jgi:drug/metabolite transporter (DMT)-like permease